MGGALAIRLTGGGIPGGGVRWGSWSSIRLGIGGALKKATGNRRLSASLRSRSAGRSGRSGRDDGWQRYRWVLAVEMTAAGTGVLPVEVGTGGPGEWAADPG